MKLEVFAICDAATVTGGKLNILGAFDSIQAGQLPAVHPQCTIALRLRFSRLEEGNHRINLNFIDDDGHSILPPIDGTVSVKVAGEEESAVANFLVNVQQLKFERAGSYSVNLAIDTQHECSLPLSIKTIPTPS